MNLPVGGAGTRSGRRRQVRPSAYMIRDVDWELDERFTSLEEALRRLRRIRRGGRCRALVVDAPPKKGGEDAAV